MQYTMQYLQFNYKHYKVQNNTTIVSCGVLTDVYHYDIIIMMNKI